LVYEVENSVRINNFIDTSAGIAKTDRTFRIIWYDGSHKDLEVFRIRLNLLTYNFDNLRVEYQIRARERQLGYKLDFEDPNHRSIYSELFEDSLRGKKANNLKKDILNRLQREPGIISYGGVILDGNRRYMVLKDLLKDESGKPEGTPDKYRYLDVVRLPKDLPKQSMLEIQARNQMADDFKEDYNPMNQLLAIRKFKDSGFNNNKISSLLNLKVKEIEYREQQLDLIDEFLEMNNQDFKYELIQQFEIIDHFTELRKTLQGHAKYSGLEGKELKNRLSLIKKITFKWLKNNIDPRLKKGKETLGSREIIRGIKVIVNSDEYKDTIEEALKQGDDLEGKQKMHRLLYTAVRSSQDLVSEKMLFTLAKRVESNLNKIKNGIESNEYEYDEDELLPVLKTSKDCLNEILENFPNDKEENGINE